ncbi:hypothetical protein PV328_012193 [Microctonus aethiopoides]|uniref:Exonuclease domain-containing protein n=1 Tax=Microctonus aethiopoides TaxID=144406 RepID=A0AA39C2M2_9HYME|nr:hypothetical protein PV328_012193 [Microctonus aethiopoides]
MSGMGPTMERAINATITKENYIPESIPLQDNCKTVIVDTETTDFEANANIVHLAAVCDSLHFEAYMMPKVKIHPKASEVTGFSVSNNRLLYLGNVVETVSLETAANQFLSFLKSCSSQILIVGHNIIRFDAPIIIRFMEEQGLLESLCNLTFGFTDTIPLIRQGKIAKQDALAKLYLTGPEWSSYHGTAHNALTDCLLLRGLLEHFSISDEVLKSKTLTTREFFQRRAVKEKQKINLPSLQPFKTCVSTAMLNTMAKNGLTVEELKSEFKIHGKKGIEACLEVQINGKPRVTVNKKIIQSVTDCAEKLLSSENVSKELENVNKNAESGQS